MEGRKDTCTCAKKDLVARWSDRLSKDWVLAALEDDVARHMLSKRAEKPADGTAPSVMRLLWKRVRELTGK